MLRPSSGIIPIIAVIAAVSVAHAQPTGTSAADADTERLLQLMDKNQNGKVSRREFMDFMNAEFNRLDVNKDGQLDPKELEALRVAPSKHTGGSGSK